MEVESRHFEDDEEYYSFLEDEVLTINAEKYTETSEPLEDLADDVVEKVGEEEKIKNDFDFSPLAPESIIRNSNNSVTTSSHVSEREIAKMLLVQDLSDLLGFGD